MDNYTFSELETIYDNSNDNQKQWLLDYFDDCFNEEELNYIMKSEYD